MNATPEDLQRRYARLLDIRRRLGTFSRMGARPVSGLEISDIVKHIDELIGVMLEDVPVETQYMPDIVKAVIAHDPDHGKGDT